MSLRNLEWKLESEGIWTALSEVHDDGDKFTWTIRQKSARFHLEGSPELMGATACTSFDTLKRAQAEAQSTEDVLVAELTAHHDVDDEDWDDDSPTFDDDEEDDL